MRFVWKDGWGLERCGGLGSYFRVSGWFGLGESGFRIYFLEGLEVLCEFSFGF